MNTLLYCHICWQEFDHPQEHDAASSHAGKRLNGHCPGDIRKKERGRKPKVKRDAGPNLNLDSADPLVLR